MQYKPVNIDLKKLLGFRLHEKFHADRATMIEYRLGAMVGNGKRRIDDPAE